MAGLLNCCSGPTRKCNASNKVANYNHINVSNLAYLLPWWPFSIIVGHNFRNAHTFCIGRNLRYFI